MKIRQTQRGVGGVASGDTERIRNVFVANKNRLKPRQMNVAIARIQYRICATNPFDKARV